MSIVTRYPAGTFCWMDLGTTDQENAKQYYSSLFGWTPDDRPIGEGRFYTMLNSADKPVAALYQMDEQQQSGGYVTAWMPYVSVDRIDESVARVRELGGLVEMEPVDVFQAGRMAIIADPTGAVVALWQPNQHIGIELKDEPGTMCWVELATSDTEKAAAFYSALFGWEAKKSSMDNMDYTVFSLGGEMVAGMMPLLEEWGGSIPPHWLIYLTVTDCDDRVRVNVESGGKVLRPSSDTEGIGRWAVLQDPQGGAFAIIQPVPVTN